MKSLICFFLGHPKPVLHWGRWINNPEIGRHRILTTECPRCRCVFGLTSQVDGEPWTP